MRLPRTLLALSQVFAILAVLAGSAGELKAAAIPYQTHGQTWPWTYGNGALWGVGNTAPCGGKVPVLRVDGRTGASRVVTSVPRLGGCAEPTGDVYVGGAFWFINSTKLFRVSG